MQGFIFTHDHHFSNLLLLLSFKASFDCLLVKDLKEDGFFVCISIYLLSIYVDYYLALMIVFISIAVAVKLQLETGTFF